MSKTFAALIVAAGRGERAAQQQPKQYCDIGGKPMLWHCIHALQQHPAIASVQVVWNPDDAALYSKAVKGLTLPPPVDGAATRQASVLNGMKALAAMPHTPSHVLIHDAARPFVSQALISRAISAMDSHDAAIPVCPVTDTIKVVDDGHVINTPSRDTLRAVQTPQAFALAPLLKAHLQALAEDWPNVTDDASLMEMAGHAVAIFDGELGNIKMTNPQDFSTKQSLSRRPRIGQGYDVHAFGEGVHVTLGGVRIPHSRGIDAHSDGDVLLHALTDALLGAIGEGDIGQHFPPSDMRWKGAASEQFVAHALQLVKAKGGQVENADLSLIAEEPRIGPHRAAIIANVARMLELPMDCIGLKATTNERMGFLGRGEGLAALATVLLTLPAAGR